MELETLLVDQSDGIVTVNLNRPQRKNAINDQMWDELLHVLGEIAEPTRVVVITGAGGDFCSGADVSDIGAAEHRPHPLSMMRRVGEVCLTIQRLAQPTIAKVRGVAVGAGMNMALMCDLVVAGESARFSEIFARRGLSIDFGGSWVLPRRIGMHRAKELALLADIIDARQAEQLGLVNRVVSEEQLDAFVDDWARRLAAGPPIALAQTKRLLDNAVGITLEQALDAEGAAQTVNLASADTAEAMRAFLDKREPKFVGR